MKKILKNSQFALFLLLVATVIIFGIINPDILSAASLFALARTCAVPAIFALAIMLVMILGELDMSFCMIGAFALLCNYVFPDNQGLYGCFSYTDTCNVDCYWRGAAIT